MEISLAPRNLKRLKDIAVLLAKHGRSDLLRESRLMNALGDAEQVVADQSADASALAADLEALGPTFIKLGQLLSTRPDLLPPAHLEALRRLQDRVEPFDSEAARSIVEEELGVRLSKAFSEFDPVPIASASLGQVHRAALRDGRAVAVKVQRPNIRKSVTEDLEALGEIAALLDKHTATGRRLGFGIMLEQFRKALVAELDYHREAANLVHIAENLKRFRRITVPQPVPDYTSSRVLTMDFVEGSKIEELNPLIRLEADGEELVDELFHAYLHQILVDGFFHADPHPGNILMTRDRRLSLLDLGMVGRVKDSVQQHLLRLLVAVSAGDGEVASRIVLRMSDRADEYDESRFARSVNDLVRDYRDRPLEQMQVGRAVLEVCRTAGDCGIRIEPELTLIGKALLNLDEIGRQLCPEFDPNEAVRRHAVRITAERIPGSFSAVHIMERLSEAKELVEMLPSRLNRFLDTVSNNELRLNVDVVDEHELLLQIQKIANRITSGLVLAALIVGAALMMDVETDMRLFGYPAIALLCFLSAAAGGSWLLWNTMIHDRHGKSGDRKRREPGT